MATFRENALFKGLQDGRERQNACVGNNGGPYDFFDYAKGYLDATKVLLEGALQSGAIIDELVYPICLNFRHGIELYIKYLVKSLAKLTDSDQKITAKHSVRKNWRKAKPMLEKSGLKIDEKDIALFETVIDCIMEVDAKGEVFRYPESIKEDRHLKDWALINLFVIEDHRKKIWEVAYDWHCKIEYNLEYLAEDRASSRT